MGTNLLAAISVSTGLEEVLLVLLFGFFGYLFAVRTRRAIGTTPWRLPAIAWGIFSGLLPIWGLMLEMIARFTTRHAGPTGGSGWPNAGQRPGGSGTVGPQRWGTNWPSGDPGWPPQGQQGQNSWPPQGQYQVPLAEPDWRETGAVTGEPMVPPSPGPSYPRPPLFGWYPDPEGRHEERYFDGRLWSDWVRDEGRMVADPLLGWRPPSDAATG